MATTGTFEGHVVGIYIGAVRIAACLAQNFNRGVATRNVNNADTGDWDTKAYGRKNWSVSGRAHFQFNAGYGYEDLADAMDAETTLTVLVATTSSGDATWTGSGLITQLNASFPDHENSEYDFTIEGSGLLTKGTVAA